MRITLRHPTDAKATAAIGHDHMLGWFAEVRVGRRVETYDALTHGETTLVGALETASKHGFFDMVDLLTAHRLLANETPEEMEDASVRRCAELLLQLKRGAAE